MIYRIKGLFRFVLFWLLAPLVRYKAYGNPGGVGGWQGYHILPKPPLTLAFLDNAGARHFFWSVLLVFLFGALILAPSYALAQDEVTPPAEVTVEPTPEPVTIDPDLIVGTFNSARDTIVIIAAVLGGGITILGGLSLFFQQRSIRDLGEKLYNGAAPETQEQLRRNFEDLRDLTSRVMDFLDDVTDGTPGGKADTLQVSKARDKPDSFG